MKPSPPRNDSDPFSPLLADPGKPAQLLPSRIALRQGRPFLLLPCNSRQAKQTLSLYAAQTSAGRLARTVMGCTLGAGWWIGTKPLALQISPDGALLQFFRRISKTDPDNLPAFGALAGNPTTAGQRIIFSVFGSPGCPDVIVKAGASETARKLVSRERTILQSLPPGILSVPKITDTLETDRISALAMPFYPGDSPKRFDERDLGSILTSWLLPETCPLRTTPVWQRLAELGGTQPLFRQLDRNLRDATARTCVFHGDFAAWNIRVGEDGKWIVLDWERGEVGGIPGWDWIHYVVQRAVLVRADPPLRVSQRIEDLLSSNDFQTYASLAGIAAYTKTLAMAYLLHVEQVIRPAEGLQRTSETLKILASKWITEQ